MKKLALLLAVASSVSARGVVTVDMNRLLMETEQGRAVQKEISQRAQEVQDRQQHAVQEAQSMRDSLAKQAKALSPAALQQKQLDLAMNERRLERELRGQTEDLQLLAKQKEAEVRSVLTDIVSDMVEAREWDALLDRSAPGFMACRRNTEVDEDVIAHANKLFSDNQVLAKAPTIAAEAVNA